MTNFNWREVHERVNVTRLDHNYTIQFQQKRYWQYVEEMSNGSLDDPITTLNVPLLVYFENVKKFCCDFNRLNIELLIECGVHYKICSIVNQKRIQCFRQSDQYWSLYYENGGRTPFCRLFWSLVRFRSANTARIPWYPSGLWQVWMVLWGKLLVLALLSFSSYFIAIFLSQFTA